MRILLLTHYFSPDLSACAFRSAALAVALEARMPLGAQLDVVTSRPMRYQSFTAAAPDRETRAGVSIVRLPLPSHKSGMVDQSLAFASFARAVMREVAGRRYDVVFATSSRLMTAVLGAWVARRTHARLSLDIRDIFVDSLQEVASPLVARPLTPVLSRLERWAVGRADAVNLVSRGFAGYFEARYPGRAFTYLTNGIDEEFLAGAPERARPSRARDAGRPVSVVYAGNLGEGQGLHVILPPLASRLGTRARFTVIGDGGRRGALEAALAAAGVSNVEWRPPMTRGPLLDLYRAADVLFLHLNDYAAFRKVLPSKIFEYAAMGKPVWAGVAGYAADFIRAEVANAVVFDPCDVDGAVASFDRLTLADAPRQAFVTAYNRRHLSEQLADQILAVGKASR
jgi:glycosyltransferase involved in cell wall biosynthesis